MSFIANYGSQILQRYNEDLMSIEQIAEELDTYPNKVRRALIKLGATIRSRSESQKIALEQGRSVPPMLGKKHDEETKHKIADKVHEAWANLSDEEREERRQKALDAWNNLSPAEQEQFKRVGNDAIRKTATEGSKLEKYVESLLTDEGYDIIIHKKALVQNVNLELDMLIASMRVVIEIDGPSHFLPIWGEDSLNRNIKSDNVKNGLLLKDGYCIIRVKNMKSSTTKRDMRLAGEKIMAELKRIEKAFPKKSERLIEVEIK